MSFTLHIVALSVELVLLSSCRQVVLNQQTSFTDGLTWPLFIRKAPQLQLSSWLDRQYKINFMSTGNRLITLLNLYIIVILQSSSCYHRLWHLSFQRTTWHQLVTACNLTSSSTCIYKKKHFYTCQLTIDFLAEYMYLPYSCFLQHSWYNLYHCPPQSKYHLLQSE